MKLNQILQEIDYGGEGPTGGDLAADAAQERFVAAMKNSIREDFTSLFDATDDIDIDDEAWDRIEAAVPERLRDVDGFENMYIYNDDVKNFQSIISRNPQVAFKLVKSEEEIMDSGYADDVADKMRDSDERTRDEYGYHGVSRKDFM